MFGIGMPELIIILVIILIIFGAGKLPEIGAGMGKAIKNFKGATAESENIDPDKIEEAITPRTKAIIPVHLAGQAAEMDRIMEIARKYDLLVIEDCAHAIESEYHGKKAGLFGDISCFSFYVTKNVITGEGGMVITNDDRFAEKIKVLGLHGMSKDAWKRFSDDGYKHYGPVNYGLWIVQGPLLWTRTRRP